MKIVVSGASGLVGKALCASLKSDRHEVVRLVRRPASSAGEIEWYPDQGRLDERQLSGIDVAVHLAGENIAAGRWNAARKKLILESRVEGTRLLAEALARVEEGPRVLVSASAIGFYGDRGDDWLAEDSPRGEGFLAEVCAAWEAAADPARNAGIRVVHPRIGVVLSPDGGALAKMLLPFKLGLGGPIGSGRNWMSWISIDDLVGVIRHTIDTASLEGPVNAVAPEPETFVDFARTLGRVLSRPAFLPMPALAARLALGQMADELLLASTRVKATKVMSAGFTFRHAALESAFRAVLGKPARSG